METCWYMPHQKPNVAQYYSDWGVLKFFTKLNTSSKKNKFSFEVEAKYKISIQDCVFAGSYLRTYRNKIQKSTLDILLKELLC
jgi:hypothetical protein